MGIFNKLFKDKNQLNPGLADELMKKTQKEIETMPPINILVAGKTGSGKSTLINALFREKMAYSGVGMPVTQSLTKITKEGVPLTLYDTRGLELTAESQREVLNSLSQAIKKQQLGNERDKIHVVYYCLNHGMGRIEAFEVELIKSLAQQLPVIVVLTRNLNSRDKEFEVALRDMQLPVAIIQPVLAKAYSVDGNHIVKPHGLNELVNQTLAIVPSEVHKAFINAQQIDMNRKVADARGWAKTYVKSAFGVGFIPIPIADAALLVPMQLTMLAHLTAIFGVSLDKAQIVSLLASVGGTSGTTYFGKMIVSSVFKLIPGLGTITGGVVTGVTASVMTLGLGYSYVEVLRQIALAEMTGRDIKIKELQAVMTRSFNEQMSVLGRFVPEDISKLYLPTWLTDFLDKN